MVISLIVNVLNYLFNVFLARNLTDIDFGFYNAAVGIITLVQIPTIAIQTALTKKVAQNKDTDLTKFKNRSTIQLLIISLVVSSLFYLLGEYVSDIANIPIKYILPLSLVLFGSILTPIVKGFLLGLEKILAFNLIFLIETVLKFVIAGIGINRGMDLTPAILAFVLPMIFVFLATYPFVNIQRKVKEKDIKLDYKEILLILTTFLLLNMPFTLDLILVNQDVRASYGALALVGKITYFASITIATVMISKLANSKEKEKKKNLILSLIISLLTGLGISIFLLLFKERIVQTMFDGKYMEIVGYIFPYSIAMTGYAFAYMVITSLLVDSSYIHIILLIITSVIQVILFRMYNESIDDVYANQIVIYGLLTLFSIFILFFNKYKNG
jgi:O-antigen/teichoic acid export membrane protein